MAYSVPWDETRPPGATTPAADLDVVIQDVQIALRERLEQVIEDFGNDLVDPKIMVEGTARVLVDLETNLPALPDFEGQVFFAEDTLKLYVGDSTPVWVLQNPSTAGHPVGSLADRPAGAEGDWWYRAKETVANAAEGVSYIRDDISWRILSPLIYGADYDDTQAPGSKVGPVGQMPVAIFGFFEGTTDGSGSVFVNFREFQDKMESQLGIKNVLNKNQLVGVFATIADPDIGDRRQTIWWEGYDNIVTPDSIEFVIWILRDGSGTGGERASNDPVNFSFLLLFNGTA